jgi:hypothetical protein
LDRVQKKSILSSVIDLEYLLQEMVIAQCWEWALVIATVLFNVDVILTILKDHFSLWRIYKPFLATLKA